MSSTHIVTIVRPQGRKLGLTSIREITRSYLTKERGWEFIAEFLFFALLAGLSIPPIVEAVAALHAL